MAFPNPQDALPLPKRTSLERYKKIAKELVKACRSGDESAFLEWSERWMDALARLNSNAKDRALAKWIRGHARVVARFAREKMTGAKGGRSCVLADAQFVIARSHGFLSWQKFARHLEELERACTATARFERAANAIVCGDVRTLKRLLREDPKLIAERSKREHGATLLHYAAANGVEGYRQITPQNIVAVARVLLDAGAEVDATAEMYGGKCTTLGLAATSVHPEKAGVQNALMQLLLDRGASMEAPDLAGNKHSLVEACLANGRPSAAEYLAQRGARLNFVEAAALGRLELVKAQLDEKGRLKMPPSVKELESALNNASLYGRRNVVEFLLARWPKLAVQEGGRQTALHCAVIGGHLDLVRLLLRHGALLEVKNEYGGSVLGQALWSAAHGGEADTYIPLIEILIEAGAKLQERHVPVTRRVDEFLAKHRSIAEPSWHWFGEE
jgi:ankyrin repeat protein